MANNDNIIYARFNHGHEITTDPRSQYAYGQVVKISGLHLPASFDADIANKGDKQAKATIGTNNELPIDDNYFLSGKDIIIMINVHATDKDGRTKYIINIPINKRSKRADIELEPVEQDVVSTAIATLNEAIERTSADVESAENSANRAHESAVSAEQSATNASNSEELVKQFTERAETAAENSEKSETNAKASEESAKQSESHAEQIVNDIEQYTERAETASRNAESSATIATEKADEISESAYIATTKADEASNAATYAQQAATYAGEAANSAFASADKSELNAQKTQSDKEVVELAKSDVMSAVDSAQNYAESAQSANEAIQNMNVQAVTLDVGSDVTVEKTVDPETGAVTLTYGIPKGVKGDKGDTGEQGIQGIQGEKGEKGDQGIQGIQGEKGEQGIQGIQGERGEKGEKGEKGDKGDVGDDYVLTEQDKEDIAGLVDTPVDDVQINGESIVENGVANVPIADGNTAGAVKINPYYGIGIFNGQLLLNAAQISDIKIANTSTKAVSAVFQHASTFYGLAKASGDTTQSQSDNPVGQYTDEAKASIQTMLDVPSKSDIPEVNVDDVRINGQSIVESGVANIPYGSNDNYGLLKASSTNGIFASGGVLSINNASESDIKGGTEELKPLTPNREHMATFYGLAKASGDSTQSASSNPVGTYTDEAKASIKNMLGVEDVDIDSKASVITETATGSIVSFDDGADDMPLQSLVVDINPVQDLHGYDSPWVGGNGKNLIDSSLFKDQAGWNIISVKVKPDTAYTMSSNKDDGTGLYLYFNNVNAGGGTAANTVYSGHPVTITSTSDGYVYVSQRIASGEDSFQNYHYQIEEGSTATDWTPYENICPITGWTGCEVQRTGINVWDEEWEIGTIKVLTGESASASDRIRSKNLIPCLPSTPYYVIDPTSGNNVRLFFYADDGSFITAGNWTGNAVQTTPAKARFLRFIMAASYGTTYKNDISINYPSTDHDYHPYKGRAIPITFPTEAGTVYGAYVDVINGELVVDRYFANVSNVVNESIKEGTGYFWFNTSDNIGIPAIKGTNAKLISNRFNVYYNVNESAAENLITFYANGIIRWKEHGEMTLAEYRAYLAENPFELCYELAEPIHYPITAIGIKTLLGQNNIWADTGNVSVEYRADTELYIDKQIPDVPVDDVQINGTSILQNGVANVPIGTGTILGVVKGWTGGGTQILSDGRIGTVNPSVSEIKAGSINYKPIPPSNQHTSTFYGLAKAAGDTTQSTSSNAVGTYTSEAKTAIKQMLGVKDDYDSLVVEVSGTDPVITGKASYRYNCGELYTLSITPPSSGTMDIIFTSGATPTVLTLPETVKMPDWWAGIETNTTYEMCITDGVYCGVMSWAT